MKLNQFLAAANCNVSGGSPYQWDCYGRWAQYLDITDKNGNEIGGCVFDKVTQKVYEIEVEDASTVGGTTHVWRDLEFSDAHEEESKRRGVEDYDTGRDVNLCYIEGIILDHVRRLCGGSDTVSEDELTAEHMDEDEPPTNEDDEFAASAAAAEEEFDRILEAEREAQRNNKTYTVTIEMTYELEVTAATMEDAVAKATEFVREMKPYGVSTDNTVCWMDTYVSKETVSRKLAVLNVEM
jgi:hypothetical protein